MATFNIPWKCLDPAPVAEKIVADPIENTKINKTFAQAVSNLCDIPLSQLPQPTCKGRRLAIDLSESLYEAQIEACKYNLHGRIIWPKGSTPLSVGALKELFAWTKDFNPRAQHNSFAQIWVKLFGFSQEYWHKHIMFSVASCIGTPICTDSITAKPRHERTFGQFARVLVEMDLSQPLHEGVWVNRKGYSFFVEFEYENLPDFCNNCLVIGHHVDNCKRLANVAPKPLKDITNKSKTVQLQKQVFVPKPQQSKPAEEINVEKETVNVEDSSGKIQSPILETKGQTTFDASTSHVGLETVLSPKELFKEQDMLLEKELNTNTSPVLVSSDSNSKDSFVQATQQNLEDDGNSSASAVIITPTSSSTPERVLKDMVFLKESWANMVETEQEQEDDGTPDIEEPDGFTVALSKNQRKQQKKKSKSSKDSYLTRSKRFVLLHKPDFVFISEPWMNFDDLPRRWLLNLDLKLFAVNTRYFLPWCFIGDFNVILGAHEYRGSFSPARLPMADFQDWTNAHHLVHLPTRGADFTWANG
ncbi:DUF4283 domain protein, partial [Trifolium medium]|nr:DUF4283 domain protein [Trifolium medium]